MEINRQSSPAESMALTGITHYNMPHVQALLSECLRVLSIIAAYINVYPWCIVEYKGVYHRFKHSHIYLDPRVLSHMSYIWP